MSNRQRAGKRPKIAHCGICGRGIRAGMHQIPLADGRVVCGGCVAAGCLQRRLSCGHVVTAGNMVVCEGGVYLCAWCAKDSINAVRRQGR